MGGRNKLPMKDLRALFAAAGCTDVRTYIQSGNVIFDSGAANMDGLADEIAAALAARFGHNVPVVLRTIEELAWAATANPFLEPDADPRSLHVSFLSKRPQKAAVEALDADRSPPDEFAVIGREIYLRCPNGVARSKLTNAWFDSKLGATSTMRNWNTVTKLLALAGA